MNQENEEKKEIDQEILENEQEEITIEEVASNPSSKRKPKKKKKIFLWIILVLFLFVILAVVGVYLYYTSCLEPVSDEETEVIVTIEKGSNVTEISQVLEENGLIKDSRVFRFYVSHQAENDNMQAGTYKLYTNMSVAEILEQLNNGSKYYPDLVNITFLE